MDGEKNIYKTPDEAAKDLRMHCLSMFEHHHSVGGLEIEN